MFKNPLGVTLIELLMALIISSMILSSLVPIFLSARRHFQLLNAFHSLQDNFRIAFHLFKTEIPLAGYIGCAKLTEDFPLTSHYFFLTEKNKITTYDDPIKKENSDGIAIAHASVAHSILVKNMQENDVLSVSTDIRFSPGDVLLISDCMTAEISIVKNTMMIGHHFQQITLSQPLTKNYLAHSEVSLFEWNRYYVAKTKRFTNRGLPIYALYRKDIHANQQEMIENVDNMKIQFHTLQKNAVIKAVSLRLTLSNEWLSKKPFYMDVAVT